MDTFQAVVKFCFHEFSTVFKTSFIYKFLVKTKNKQVTKPSNDFALASLILNLSIRKRSVIVRI